jgi:hypothetical protein
VHYAEIPEIDGQEVANEAASSTVVPHYENVPHPLPETSVAGILSLKTYVLLIAGTKELGFKIFLTIS